MNKIIHLVIGSTFHGQGRAQGYEVGRLHVRALMRKMGISALAPQPGASRHWRRNRAHLGTGAATGHQSAKSAVQGVSVPAWRSVKYERVYLRAYQSVSAAKTDIAEYIDWYNGERGHSSLEGKTPEQAWLSGLPCLKAVA